MQLMMTCRRCSRVTSLTYKLSHCLHFKESQQGPFKA